MSSERPEGWKPVTCRWEGILPKEGNALMSPILDPENWATFEGYGPLPGIASASFEARTDAVVGSRIRVLNRDGSSHLETIQAWDPGRRVVLEFTAFTGPVASLAARFRETWELSPVPSGTWLRRTFELYPRNLIGALALRCIRPFLWKAAARHATVMSR